MGETLCTLSTTMERIGLLDYERELLGGQLLYVAYTERGDNIRIISARRATRHEQDIYFHQNAE